MQPLILFPSQCQEARFVQRHKRFTVICEDRGNEILAHTNNTGSMLGLLRPGAKVLLSPAQNPKRKLAWTWELVDVDGMWVGVNTLSPNRMLRRAWAEALLPATEGYDSFAAEAKTGDSRLDAKLSGSHGDLWIECKNVTLVEDDTALFPDAVTTRGQKHLHELMTLAKTGARVALFFFVQRTDANCFGPADVVDPVYAKLFWQAVDAGVEIWAYEADLSEQGIGLGRRLPLTAR